MDVQKSKTTKPSNDRSVSNVKSNRTENYLRSVWVLGVFCEVWVFGYTTKLIVPNRHLVY